MTRQRLIMIALDAASPQLLRTWAQDGTLPNLRRLMARGLTGGIAGLDGFFIGSTWPSFYTGVNPGRHGFHYQLQLVPKTYRLQPVAKGESTKVRPFWKTLEDAGRRVAILDVPLTRLDPNVNGVQIVEWGVHDDLYGFGAAPEAVARMIPARFGPHPVGSHCDALRGSIADYEEFVARLIRSVEMKLRMTLELHAQEPWDFLIQVFSESHCVGHQCWHLRDPSHPAFDSTIAAGVGDPIKRVYKALDEAIGRLADAAGDATLIVMSAHGMTHWYGATFLLRDILFALGAAARRQTPAGGGAVLSDVARTLARFLPQRLRHPLTRIHKVLGSSRLAEPTATDGIDAARSKCFPIRNGQGTGAIRLNIAGREPEGVLQSGPEVEKFIAQLTADLLALTDAESGQRLVERVLRVDRICEGPALEVLPDLVIEWSRARAVGAACIGGGKGALVRVRHPRFGIVEGKNEYGRSGEHEPEGFFVAVGPTVRAATLKDPISLLDFAPTACRLLGCAYHSGEGRFIRDLEGTSES